MEAREGFGVEADSVEDVFAHCHPHAVEHGNRQKLPVLDGFWEVRLHESVVVRLWLHSGSALNEVQASPVIVGEAPVDAA